MFRHPCGVFERVSIGSSVAEFRPACTCRRNLDASRAKNPIYRGLVPRVVFAHNCFNPGSQHSFQSGSRNQRPEIDVLHNLPDVTSCATGVCQVGTRRHVSAAYVQRRQSRETSADSPSDWHLTCLSVCYGMRRCMWQARSTMISPKPFSFR